VPYSGKRRFPYRITIYIPQEKERIVKDFIEAFRARNESASQKILSFIENYDDLVIFRRKELKHIISLIRKGQEEGIRILERKASSINRVNPQTRLSQYESEKQQRLAPVKCGFGSKKNPCDKPAVAIAVNEFGEETPVCKYHFVLIAQSKTSKWRIKDYSPGRLGHAPIPRRRKGGAGEGGIPHDVD